MVAATGRQSRLPNSELVRVGKRNSSASPGGCLRAHPGKCHCRFMRSSLAELIGIVRRITGVRRIVPTSRLFHDLGMAGDDASEVLEEVAAKFGVIFPGFDFDRYFPQENEAFGAHLARMFRLRLRREPLTLEHLARVADYGVWFDPPIAAGASGADLSAVTRSGHSAAP